MEKAKNYLISLCIRFCDLLFLHLRLLNGILKLIRQISFPQLKVLDGRMQPIWEPDVQILFHFHTYGCSVHEEIVGIPTGALL